MKVFKAPLALINFREFFVPSCTVAG